MNNLHYDAVEIRHEPDGELLAFFNNKYFKQEDVINVIRVILKGSNNFSINGVHTYEEHSCFDNNLPIHRSEKC